MRVWACNEVFRILHNTFVESKVDLFKLLWSKYVFYLGDSVLLVACRVTALQLEPILILLDYLWIRHMELLNRCYRPVNQTFMANDVVTIDALATH